MTYAVSILLWAKGLQLSGLMRTLIFETFELLLMSLNKFGMLTGRGRLALLVGFVTLATMTFVPGLACPPPFPYPPYPLWCASWQIGGLVQARGYLVGALALLCAQLMEALRRASTKRTSDELGAKRMHSLVVICALGASLALMAIARSVGVRGPAAVPPLAASRLAPLVEVAVGVCWLVAPFYAAPILKSHTGKRRYVRMAYMLPMACGAALVFVTGAAPALSVPLLVAGGILTLGLLPPHADLPPDSAAFPRCWLPLAKPHLTGGLDPGRVAGSCWVACWVACRGRGSGAAADGPHERHRGHRRRDALPTSAPGSAAEPARPMGGPAGPASGQGRSSGGAEADRNGPSALRRLLTVARCGHPDLAVRQHGLLGAICLLTGLVGLVAGTQAGSLSLAAASLHLLMTRFWPLGHAVLARFAALWPPERRMSFGYVRLVPVADLVLVALVGAGALRLCGWAAGRLLLGARAPGAAMLEWVLALSAPAHVRPLVWAACGLLVCCAAVTERAGRGDAAGRCEAEFLRSAGGPRPSASISPPTRLPRGPIRGTHWLDAVAGSDRIGWDGIGSDGMGSDRIGSDRIGGCAGALGRVLVAVGPPLAELVVLVLVRLTGWCWLDGAWTLAVCALTLRAATPVLFAASRLLLHRTPPRMRDPLEWCIQKARRYAAPTPCRSAAGCCMTRCCLILAMEGVAACTDAHFWELAPGETVGTMRVEVLPGADTQHILRTAQDILIAKGVTRPTLQLHCPHPLPAGPLVVSPRPEALRAANSGNPGALAMGGPYDPALAAASASAPLAAPDLQLQPPAFSYATAGPGPDGGLAAASGGVGGGGGKHPLLGGTTPLRPSVAAAVTHEFFTALRNARAGTPSLPRPSASPSASLGATSPSLGARSRPASEGSGAALTSPMAATPSLASHSTAAPATPATPATPSTPGRAGSALGLEPLLSPEPIRGPEAAALPSRPAPSHLGLSSLSSSAALASIPPPSAPPTAPGPGPTTALPAGFALAPAPGAPASAPTASEAAMAAARALLARPALRAAPKAPEPGGSP
ncbi:hypothetical protein PAPYR_6165 [Paratrimastix pyriformis]|uniref:Cation efflux protein transmembrane domain-containing protein n=1 Tax=Paratrimastix pyriformis TaxID=342808 RepID=A0ABQ8UG05_9EUKA|nr:hypothetical protein PAPYR_6165 [Paratrimastix pyriformis]